MNPHKRIAYLTTEYPHVSHTFIRREILCLERLGFEIRRVSIRSGGSVVEEIDRSEDSKTLHLLEQKPLAFAQSVLTGLLRASGRLAAISAVLRMARRSDRGLLRHLAYLVEALSLYTHLASEDIEHVHVHFGTNAAAVAMLLKKLGGPTFSMTVHGPDEFDAPIGFSLGEKVQESEFTAAISNYCVSQLRRWVPFSQWHKIHVVRCSVDESWFREKPLSTETNARFVSVGRMSEQKGQLDLLLAFSKLVQRAPQAKLTLIGDGHMREIIESRIQELELSQSVHLTGWLDGGSIQAHLLEACAFVLPSYAEGLPVVLMEAMALQTPVISTSIMGIPELVNEQNGWLITVRSTEALTDAMASALEADPEELRRMGASGQQSVRQYHDIETNARDLAQLFPPMANP